MWVLPDMQDTVQGSGINGTEPRALGAVHQREVLKMVHNKPGLAGNINERRRKTRQAVLSSSSPRLTVSPQDYRNLPGFY